MAGSLPGNEAVDLRQGVARQLAQAQRDGRLSDVQWLAIDKNLNGLAETSGACERIARPPIPYTFLALEMIG